MSVLGEHACLKKNQRSAWPIGSRIYDSSEIEIGRRIPYLCCAITS
jgi:hypothetical protein